MVQIEPGWMVSVPAPLAAACNCTVPALAPFTIESRTTSMKFVAAVMVPVLAIAVDSAVAAALALVVAVMPKIAPDTTAEGAAGPVHWYFAPVVVALPCQTIMH